MTNGKPKIYNFEIVKISFLNREAFDFFSVYCWILICPTKDNESFGSIDIERIRIFSFFRLENLDIACNDLV